MSQKTISAYINAHPPRDDFLIDDFRKTRFTNFPSERHHSRLADNKDLNFQASNKFIRRTLIVRLLIVGNHLSQFPSVRFTHTFLVRFAQSPRFKRGKYINVRLQDHGQHQLKLRRAAWMKSKIVVQQKA